jgi:hypothetical protein
MTVTAQWKEITKDRLYALCVHGHHRVAIAQVLENQEWLVTMPDSPNDKHPAKTQVEAFKIGRRVSLQWMQAAIEQLQDERPEVVQMLSPEQNLAEIRSRSRSGSGKISSKPKVPKRAIARKTN